MKKWHLLPSTSGGGLLERVLANRGIASADEFLNPRLNSLRNPYEIPGLAAAAERVLSARAKREKILVYGDYDVDGVTGTAILLQTLRHLGLDPAYYIPHRYGEGYSLSLEAVKKIAAEGVKLIITVDCGISSAIEIEAANALGLDVIVTDHHNLPKQLPLACGIVNPKMIDGEHPSKNLSGAGVAFKFAWGLLRAAGEKDGAFLTSLLDLAALGTFSDVVPLTGENRVLAVFGLNLINERKRVGIRCLLEAAGIHGQVTPRQVYFGLAPRLNAAGRLEHASKAVELLMTDDPVQAGELARELNRINSRRQDIGVAIKSEAFAAVDEKEARSKKLLVLSGQGWHPGVIGIVASQIAETFWRPTVLIGINDGVGRGSARSVDSVNIFEILESCRDLFLDFGGHAGAAGFEIETDKVPELKRRLEAIAEETIKPESLTPTIEIDAELDPGVISLQTAKEISRLAPFGAGNEAPVFMLSGQRLEEMRRVGADRKHLKARFGDFEAIGFGMSKNNRNSPQLIVGNDYDLAFNLESNEFNGFETVQLSLVDIRESTSSLEPATKSRGSY